MGVRLDQTEIDEFLTSGHTLILTSTDRDGYPHAAPLWYAYIDGHIYTRTMRKSQKAANIARDPKVCCLVETGERWRELKAVMIRGRAVEVEDEAMQKRFDATLSEKYANFRESGAAMPKRTQQHYAAPTVWWKIVPEKRSSSWDNRKIRLGR